MKVLFIHNTMPEYRIPFFFGLSERIDVKYLFTNKELSANIYGTHTISEDVKKINFTYLPKGTKKYKEIYKNIKEAEYVVLPPMDTFSDLICALFTFINSKMRKCKVLYFGEKWEAPKSTQPFKKKIKNFLQRSAFKLILKRIDMCIVSGSKSKEYFRSIGLKDEKISIAIDASGVNKDLSCIYDIRKAQNLEENAKIILYYGRIIERKGLDILLKSYSKIKNRENIYLLVCGDGPFKKNCEELTNELNLKNVIFQGAVDPKNKYNFFSQCDIFVLPSYFYNGTPEAWGLTVNEALLCKKTVIATTAVGAAYDLLNGENGEMVQAGSINELTGALEKFLFEETDKNQDHNNRNSKSPIKFNYENMVKSFIDAIRKCS